MSAAVYRSTEGASTVLCQPGRQGEFRLPTLDKTRLKNWNLLTGSLFVLPRTRHSYIVYQNRLLFCNYELFMKSPYQTEGVNL